jgi:expansin (peptidoglycan-binding protein)
MDAGYFAPKGAWLNLPSLDYKHLAPTELSSSYVELTLT